jgi:hypothetical protein
VGILGGIDSLIQGTAITKNYGQQNGRKSFQAIAEVRYIGNGGLRGSHPDKQVQN